MKKYIIALLIIVIIPVVAGEAIKTKFSIPQYKPVIESIKTLSNNHESSSFKIYNIPIEINIEIVVSDKNGLDDIKKVVVNTSESEEEAVLTKSKSNKATYNYRLILPPSITKHEYKIGVKVSDSKYTINSSKIIKIEKVIRTSPKRQSIFSKIRNFFANLLSVFQ